MDGESHPIFWGAVQVIYVATAIFVGVEFGWKAGVTCFLVPICVYLGGFLISAAVLLAVNLLVYGVVEGLTRTGGWIHQTFRNTMERRKRRKQARAICQRCGLPLSALPPEEALVLSEADIQTISWAAYKSNQATAERIAHVLADPAARQLLPNIPELLRGGLTTDKVSLRDTLLQVLTHQVRKQGFQTMVSIYHVRTMEDAENFLMLTGEDYVDILNDFSKYGRIAAEATAAKRVLTHKGIFLDV